MARILERPRSTGWVEEGVVLILEVGATPLVRGDAPEGLGGSVVLLSGRLKSGDCQLRLEVLV